MNDDSVAGNGVPVYAESGAAVFAPLALAAAGTGIAAAGMRARQDFSFADIRGMRSAGSPILYILGGAAVGYVVAFIIYGGQTSYGGDQRRACSDFYETVLVSTALCLVGALAGYAVYKKTDDMDRRFGSAGDVYRRAPSLVIPAGTMAF